MNPISVYLNDHLAGSIVALDLARRSAATHASDRFGGELAAIAEQIAEDQLSLRRTMLELSVEPRLPKQVVAVGTAWADQVRHLLSGSHTPTFVRDLELLIMGIRGKELLWGTMAHIPLRLEPSAGTLKQRAVAQGLSLVALHAEAVAAEGLGQFGTLTSRGPNAPSRSDRGRRSVGMEPMSETREVSE